MSSSEFEESTVRELRPDGCQTPAELRSEEDGGDRQIPATRDGGSSQIPETRDGGEGDALTEEVEDGYRTPTSPQHRIPEALECPPAPRKPKKEVRLKRKRSFDALHVDTVEVESFLRRIIGELLADGGRKVRKVGGE
ncbi:cyclin-dependent protein kinase inhibitor SMR3-like [Nymphaea colorata]|nr:cyclin-dependent protein kinase inhibitor SMR3-like [Nymphaea colorata]